jgi:hypothetical protein
MQRVDADALRRQRVLVDGHEVQLRAVGGEPAGGGETDPGLATGDQGDSAPSRTTAWSSTA